MKTLTFFIYSMDIGGTERVTHDLINELASRGYCVYLICLVKRGEFLNNLLIADNHIFEVGTCSNLLEFLKVKNKISKIINNTNTNRLISMGEYPNIISPFLKFNGKSVIVEHSTKTFYSSPEEYNLKTAFKLLARIAYKKAKKILCVSENIKEIIIKKDKSLTKKTFVIYNPIDIENIKKLSKEDINYNTSKTKIISVGRLVSAKNYPLLLNAFAKYYMENKNIELWIVGDGILKNELQNLCKKLKIEHAVIFWGYQINPYKFISKADLFISSSNYEGFAVTILEAIYLKKRIIATRSLTDLNELINKDIGRLTPVGDEIALYSAIKNEINEHIQISEIPEIINRFSLHYVTNEYLKYLEY